MRTNMVKKYFCLVVVLLFLIPTVTALNNRVENQNNNNEFKSDGIVYLPDRTEIVNQEVIEFIPENRMSQEVQEILKEYSLNELDQDTRDYLVRFNEKMLERRALFSRENPHMPYEPVEIIGKVAKRDPVTGESISMFPGARLRSMEPTMLTSEDYKQDSMAFSPYLKTTSTTGTNQEPSGTRGARQPPEVDIELYRLEWTNINSGWGDRYEIEQDSNGNQVPGEQYSYGGFQIGKKTTFTASIRNNNPAAGAISVWVNFSMSDYYGGLPMQRNPTSYKKTVGSTPVTVTHDFTPKFAADLLVQCLVDYENDPTPNNNYIGWRGIPTFIWSADFESGGTNYGWQQLTDGSPPIVNSASDWTGDLGPTNQWHITSSPANNNAEAHTGSNAWYHGEDRTNPLPDIYDDNFPGRNIDPDYNRNHTYLQTPYVNMGDILDGSDVIGNLPEDHYYVDFMPLVCELITGDLEYETDAQGDITYRESDFVMVDELDDENDGNPSDDDWRGGPYIYTWRWISGDFSTWELMAATPLAQPHWNPAFHGRPGSEPNTLYIYPGIPTTYFTSDGQGDVKNIIGARNFTTPGIRWRLDFDGDGEQDNTGHTGIYADDFAAWGIQDYTVEKRVGLSDMTYPKTGDVSILYKDSTASFKTTVENYGKQHSFNVKIVIEDMVGNEVHTETKSAGNLANGDDKEIQWSWVPDEEGDYKLYVIVGNYDDDWTPGDNKGVIGASNMILDHYLLHVRSSIDDDDVDVLLVDDDDSYGQYGIWFFNTNTEIKMAKALEDNDLKYRICTVGYNETGPTYDVMKDYELIIWMTGLDNEYNAHGGRNNFNRNNPAWDVTLKEDDIDELKLFLANKGNKLWLISPGALYDYYDSDRFWPCDGFFRNQLHIDRCRANMTEWNNDYTQITKAGTPNPLEGVPNSVMDKVSYVTYDPPEPPWKFTDIGGGVFKVDAVKQAEHLFYQDDSHDYYNALLYSGDDYMSAFFAFNFYLINDELERQECAYKVLTKFGMTGGVIVEPIGTTLQTVYPGDTVSYQFRVTNTGKKSDTMTLTAKALAPPTDPLKYNDWSTRIEIDGVPKNSVTIQGLKDKTNVYLYVTAPTLDDVGGIGSYLAAGEVVRFEVKAVSANTNLDNSTTVSAKVPAIGENTISCPTPVKEIEVDKEAKFPLVLLNETNGVDDITVKISFSGDGADLAKFYVSDQPTTNKKVSTVLEPNEENDEIKLYMIADEHTLAGWHNLTVYLKDETEGITYDSVNLSLKVKQFYQVATVTTGDENGDVNFTIDPNQYVQEDEDYIIKTFTINVRNYGNGLDDIELSWDQNPLSDNFKEIWYDDEGEGVQPGIYTKSGSITDNITSIEVSYYDETTKPNYGEEVVYFDVFIPIDVEIGSYIFDFIIDSSGTEVVGAGESENNIVSFKFDVIKPNLQFTKLNNDSEPNFEFWDYAEAILIEEDLEFEDYYIEVKHADFDFLTIEIKVWIDNIGMTWVELDRNSVWLNITHEDEFGTIIHDANLSATSPSTTQTVGIWENLEFTFLWDELDQPASNEPLEYTFTITVDPQNNIFETRDDDNTGTFEMSIKHIPKPKKKSGGGGMPGFEAAVMLAAIAVVLLGLMVTNRRRRQ